MPLRIAEHVFSGELRNSRRNGVFGWIEFAPDYGIRLELTGNFSGQLAGKHIRFKNANSDALSLCQPGEFPQHIEELSDRQIGVVQSMELRTTKVPNLPIDEFLSLPESDRDAHLTEKASLWLEWSSQDGDLLCELVQPEIEFVEEDSQTSEERSFEFGNGVESGRTELTLNDDASMHDFDADPDFDPDEEEDDEDNLSDEGEDPYGLFDENLQQNVSESLGEALLPMEGERTWEEVLPDADPETTAMYEQWDEIFEGKKDEPISYLFPTPIQLPKPEHVVSDEEAERLVKSILAQLALLSVAIDVCEHFTPQQTYRLLMQEILPTAKVHPNLAASEMVQHYASSDYCQRCDEEFEADYEAGQDDDDSGDDE